LFINSMTGSTLLIKQLFSILGLQANGHNRKQEKRDQNRQKLSNNGSMMTHNRKELW